MSSETFGVSFTNEEKAFLSGSGDLPKGDTPAAAPEKPVEAKQPDSAPEAETKPEASTEAETEPKDKVQKLVDYGALAEERNKRKGLEKTVHEREQHIARIEGRLETLLAQLGQSGQPKAQEQPGDPVETDPIQVLKDLAQFKRNQEQQTQENENLSALNTRFVSDIAEFKATEEGKNYDAAVEFLAKNRADELKLMGVDPLRIPAVLKAETVHIINLAVQRGESGAKIAYQMAQMRGFNPTPVADTTQQLQKPSEIDKLNMVEKGQKASRSLSGSGSSGNLPTIQALMDMDPKDFLKVKDSDFEKAFRNL